MPCLLVVSLVQPSSSWMRTGIWMNIHGLTRTLNCSVWFGEATMQMLFQLLPPQLICKDVMLITSPDCLCESCSHFSCGFEVVGVLLPDVFGKRNENMEGAMLLHLIDVGFCEKKPPEENIFVSYSCGREGRTSLSCTCSAVCHSGKTPPDASSIITWLHLACRWKTLFSCVLYLGSCLVSFYGWGRSGSLSCRAARWVVQPQISPGYPYMRQGLWWAGTDHHSS